MGKALNTIGFLIGLPVFFSLMSGDAHCRSIDEILAEIESAGSSIRTFQADFVQKKEVALFASAVTSSGVVIVRPPDLLIWKIQEPLKALFFIDRGVAGTRDSNTGEVKRFHAAGQDAVPSYQWLIRIFSGSLQALRRSFNIEVVDKDKDEDLGLRLIPTGKRPEVGFDKILLGFDPNRLYLKKIIVWESSGDRTEIDLRNIRVNKDIDREIPSWLKEGGKR